MAEIYSTSQYLLDRANIQDLIARAYLSFDLRQFDKLESDVFAADVLLDYTVFFGGQPQKISAAEFVKSWENTGQKWKDSQHLITSTLVDLPQPGGGTIPMAAKGTVNTTVFVKSFLDRVYENKGRGFFDVIRLDDVSGNPWRISAVRASKLAFQNGSTEQMAQDYEEYLKTS